MKVLVLGGTGKIGSAVAWDLIQVDDVDAVGLVGRRREALEHTRAWLGSGKVVLHPLDISDRSGMIDLMRGYTVGVIALPDRRTSYAVAECAIEAGLHIVDMLEEYHRRPDAYETEGLSLPSGMTLDEYGDYLHSKALEQDVTFLDGIGFAPGLSNITVGEGIRKLDRVDSAIARVGGIPTKEAASRHPLRYMITWAFSHVLREYMINVKVLKNGAVVEVGATADREVFRFSRFGQDEQLECAITPGMPSFIFTRPELREFAEKTIRWPGHWSAVQTLKECGLLDLDPLRFDGHVVVPREFLLSLIEPKLQALPGETDVCVMLNTLQGVKDGKKTTITYHMWEEADKERGISAMARVTGYPSAIGAVLIGRGQIRQRGIVPPEDCISGMVYRDFMDELRRRHINILEEITPD